MEKDRKIELIRIDNVAHGGDGVGRLADGRVVFVPRTIPDEHVEIEVVEDRKTFAHGRLREVRQPSPDRVESDCPHFEYCGGCQFWHMEYEAELRHKATAAREAAERIGHVSLPEPTLHAADSVWDYRNRATFHGGQSRRGKKRLGFYAPSSNRIVDVDGCPILQPIVNQARRLMDEAMSGESRDHDVAIETASDDQVSVTVRIPRQASASKNLVKRLSTLDEELVRGIVIECADERIILGDPTVDAEQVVAHAPEQFRVPADRFRQANSLMNPTLVQIVCDRLGEGERLVEFFAGMGNFTIPAADRFRKVTAVEGDPIAVESGSALVEAAGRTGVTFVGHDLSKGWDEDLTDCVVLLDPPRGGADELSEDLADSNASRIVYVSCDAACLGRDLKRFDAAGWQVGSLDMIDMFPRTAHIETVVALERS